MARKATGRKGFYITERGHVRYTSPKELRRKYVHRVVVEELLAETPYSIRLMLPSPYEVHHLDYDKQNNAAHNLLIVSESLHSCMTADAPRYKDGRFAPKFSPKWKPSSMAHTEENSYSDAYEAADGMGEFAGTTKPPDTPVNFPSRKISLVDNSSFPQNGVGDTGGDVGGDDIPF